ncbi:MAG: hypothetical protein IJ408_05140 [Clostridia bacterium]|nr:hypothetical protein [Clostridia bacterium]
MKRYISLILVLLLMLTVCGCTKPQQTPPPADTQTGTSGTQTDTPAQNNPSAPPAEKTEKNKEVRPAFDVGGIDGIDTAALKDKTLSLYLGDSAFFAGDRSEREWFTALKEEYGLNIDFSVCSDAVLYSSQLIAQKSGKDIDLVSVKVNDMAKGITLAKKVTLPESESYPFSQRVFELSGDKLFAGKAHAKMLWYNKAIVKDDITREWSFDAFSKLADDAKKAGFGVLETKSFAEFYSCGENQKTGFDFEKGYILDIKDEDTKKMLADFAAAITVESSENKSWARENVAFCLTDTPTKRHATLGWTTLPAYGENGSNPVPLCGSALGISNTVSEENEDIALTAALLWSARYTESREDTLRFDLGLSKDDYDKYLELCEQNGLVYCADLQINALFESGTIPKEFYSDEQPDEESTLQESIEKAYARAELLNER